jgi:hypothetical protein
VSNSVLFSGDSNGSVWNECEKRERERACVFVCVGGGVLLPLSRARSLSLLLSLISSLSLALYVCWQRRHTYTSRSWPHTLVPSGLIQ